MTAAPAEPAPPPSSGPPPLERGLRVRLSLLMFLQAAIPGAWSPVLGSRLREFGFSGAETGAIFSTSAIAALIAPAVAGMLADRWFRSDRLLVGLHLLAAGQLAWLSTFTPESAPAGAAAPLFFGAALALMLTFVPTWVLAYAVVYRHLPDPVRDMPGVRVFGSLGWMVAALAVDTVLGQGAAVSGKPMALAAGLGVLTAGFALWLPATPPLPGAAGAPLGRVLGLLRRRTLGVFLPVAFVTAGVVAFYGPFMSTFLADRGVTAVASWLSVGQLAEAVVMPLAPWLLWRFGLRAAITAGIAAWAIRYGLFATAVDSAGWGAAALLTGIALHGVCISLFREAGSILVRLRSPAAMRGSAQGLYFAVTDGFGTLLGTNVAGWLVDLHRRAGAGADGAAATDWAGVWWPPAITAGVAAVIFAWWYPAPKPRLPDAAQHR